MQTTISPAATRGTTSPISVMLTAMATTFAASLATARAFIDTHRTAVGGALFTLGLALATGADDNIPQAILTLAAFFIAGRIFSAQEEKGGAA